MSSFEQNTFDAEQTREEIDALNDLDAEALLAEIEQDTLHIFSKENPLKRKRNEDEVLEGEPPIKKRKLNERFECENCNKAFHKKKINKIGEEHHCPFCTEAKEYDEKKYGSKVRCNSCKLQFAQQCVQKNSDSKCPISTCNGKIKFHCLHCKKWLAYKTVSEHWNALAKLINKYGALPLNEQEEIQFEEFCSKTVEEQRSSTCSTSNENC